jgi:RNA polymerase sigma factor (sigma-70 family)
MKAASRRSRRVRDDDPESRARREELFDRAFPLAQRAAEVRASSSPRYDYFDRDDLVQDAVAAVLAALGRYDEERASLRTFVEKIVFNGIASTLRRARAEKRTSVDLRPFSDSPDLSSMVELRLDLNRVLRTLERRDRQVARLLEEYSPAEIARALRTSRAAVYRSIDRIRAAFVEAGLDG